LYEWYDQTNQSQKGDDQFCLNYINNYNIGKTDDKKYIAYARFTGEGWGVNKNACVFHTRNDIERSGDTPAAQYLGEEVVTRCINPNEYPSNKCRNNPPPVRTVSSDYTVIYQNLINTINEYKNETNPVQWTVIENKFNTYRQQFYMIPYDQTTQDEKNAVNNIQQEFGPLYATRHPPTAQDLYMMNYREIEQSYNSYIKDRKKTYYLNSFTNAYNIFMNTPANLKIQEHIDRVNNMKIQVDALS
jgi:hypothetical protein